MAIDNEYTFYEEIEDVEPAPELGMEDAPAEREPAEVEDEGEEADPGTRAVMERKGGFADDWEKVDGGDYGYRFDGEQVRDAEGSVWTNPDTALHEAMLAQWKEGGEAVFFLPDHVEETDEGEILYVTQLILNGDGSVSYEIHRHVTGAAIEDEPLEPAEDDEYAGSAPFSHERIPLPEEEVPAAEAPETEVLAYAAAPEYVRAEAPESVAEYAPQAAEAEEYEEPAVTAETPVAIPPQAPDAWLTRLLDIDPLAPTGESVREAPEEARENGQGEERMSRAGESGENASEDASFEMRAAEPQAQTEEALGESLSSPDEAVAADESPEPFIAHERAADSSGPRPEAASEERREAARGLREIADAGIRIRAIAREANAPEKRPVIERAAPAATIKETARPEHLYRARGEVRPAAPAPRKPEEAPHQAAAQNERPAGIPEAVMISLGMNRVPERDPRAVRTIENSRRPVSDSSAAAETETRARTRARIRRDGIVMEMAA